MTDNEVCIIAEAGVNYNGRLELAEKLVDLAAEAGADAVKFQTFRADRVVSMKAEKAAYQIETTGNEESQYDMIRRLELDRAAHEKLIQRCRDRGDIAFLSSPFDLESIDLLASFGLTTFKIPSGEITNLPYLRKIGALRKEVILSTGMATMGEIEQALAVLSGAGTAMEDITVMHCNTEYPTPMEDVNLRAMCTIAQTFGVSVGYSDHTPGIEIPIAAVALGARVIEKHFTLDKGMEGPDHRASLDPQELRQMILAIRNIEKALGTGIKRPSPSELKNKTIVRKSIVAAKDITKGDLFTEKNITVKRPGSGISPMRWDEIIGQKATRDYLKDDLI